MDANEITALRARCQQSRLQAKKIAKLIPCVPVVRARFRFSSAAGFLAAEHHLSIVTLCEAGLCGTAMSLLRAVLEAGACAHWFLYAATSEKVRDLHVRPSGLSMDNPDIPGLKVMLNELAAHGPLPRVADVRDMLEPNGVGRWLHKFAHDGIAVLKGRDPTGAYSLIQALGPLIIADTFVLISASVNTVIHSAPELDKYIGERREDLGEELVNILDADAPKDSWKSLPPCTIKDPWDVAN